MQISGVENPADRDGADDRDNDDDIAGLPAWHEALPMWAAANDRARTAVCWCADEGGAAAAARRGAGRAGFVVAYSPGGAVELCGGGMPVGARHPPAVSLVSAAVLDAAALDAADVAGDLRFIADRVEPGGDLADAGAFGLRRAVYSHALALVYRPRPRTLAGALAAARRGGLPVLDPGSRNGAPPAVAVAFLPDDLCPVAVVESGSWSGLVAGLGEALALDVELIAARAGGVTVLAAEGDDRPADARHFRPALDGRWPWLADALEAGAEVVSFW